MSALAAKPGLEQVVSHSPAVASPIPSGSAARHQAPPAGAAAVADGLLEAGRGTVRVGIDLHIVYEGERLEGEDMAALVQGTLITRLPELVAGLELARVESTAAELHGGSYIERRAADAVS